MLRLLPFLYMSFLFASLGVHAQADIQAKETVSESPASTAATQTERPVTPAPSPTAPEPAQAQTDDLAIATRVAVLDPTLSDVDPAVGRVVAAAITQEIRKLERLSVISYEDVRAMLSVEEQKSALGCEDSSCLADIAGALGADIVVTITLSKVAGQSIFGMTAMNQEEAAVVGRVTRRLTPAGGEEYLAAVGEAVAELFPDRKLRENQARGVPKEVALRLNPPPLEPWVTYSVLGTSIVLFLSAVALFSTNILLFNFIQAEAGASVGDSGQALQKEQLDLGFLAVNLTLGTGVATMGLSIAVAVIGFCLAPLTDWAGVGEVE